MRSARKFYCLIVVAYFIELRICDDSGHPLYNSLSRRNTVEGGFYGGWNITPNVNKKV